MLDAVADEVVPADEMVVIFTSGSTSVPKAVVHTHGAIFRKTSVLNPGVAPPGGCVFLGQPFFWVGGLQNLGTALQNGAALVCQPKPEPAAALSLIERTGATMVIAWPNTTLRLQADPSFASRDLRAVPQLTMPSGDPELRHASLGMTETIGPHTGFARPGAPKEELATPIPESLRGSFGAPLPFMEHKIVDPDSGADLADGDEGEICVRGYALMTRMYKREREDVFDDDGWYHTGDRGYFRAGYLFFTGRLTEMIKTHGANVSPREVELVLEAQADIAAGVRHGGARRRTRRAGGRRARAVRSRRRRPRRSAPPGHRRVVVVQGAAAVRRARRRRRAVARERQGRPSRDPRDAGTGERAMSEGGAQDLETALDELYAVDPSDFMATRKQLVADLRAAGDAGGAKQLGAARRPTNAAWALNQLARRHGDLVDQFLEQSRVLREAQDQAVSGRPDELRSATRAQRDAFGGGDAGRQHRARQRDDGGVPVADRRHAAGRERRRRDRGGAQAGPRRPGSQRRDRLSRCRRFRTGGRGGGTRSQGHAVAAAP